MYLENDLITRTLGSVTVEKEVVVERTTSCHVFEELPRMVYPFEEEGGTGRLDREPEAPRVDLMDSSRTMLNRLLRKRSDPHLSSRRVATCLQGGNEILISPLPFQEYCKVRLLSENWRKIVAIIIRRIIIFVHWNWLSLLTCRREGWWTRVHPQ